MKITIEKTEGDPLRLMKKMSIEVRTTCNRQQLVGAFEEMLKTFYGAKDAMDI